MMMQKRLEETLEEIERAAASIGRAPSTVQLMAVSKTHTYEEILELFGCGQLLFGENRVQEVVEKYSSPRPEGMLVHLIGHLQSNKVKKIVGLVDAIDSVDSLKVASKISEASLALNKRMPILLQYNTSEEDSKSGFESESSLYEALDSIAQLQGVTVRGLMTIGPLHGGEDETRKAFSLLRALQESCISRYPHLDFSTLSMGMSGDFPLAIREGATMVRVGTRLFGKREYL